LASVIENISKLCQMATTVGTYPTDNYNLLEALDAV